MMTLQNVVQLCMWVWDEMQGREGRVGGDGNELIQVQLLIN